MTRTKQQKAQDQGCYSQLGEDGKPKIRMTSANKDFTLPEAHPNLQLWPSKCLDECASRQPCPKCTFSMRFYCYKCVIPLTPTPPKLRLPVNVHIWKHRLEKQSKATGVHACLLADNAYLYQHEDFPHLDSATTMVLYPSEDSKSVPELEATGTLPKDVIIIESPWKKATGMLTRPEICSLKALRLQSTYSAFWRYRNQNIGERAFKEGCSSVEAIYFLCRELHAAQHEDGDCHCFDNMLWYFNTIHNRIAETKLSEINQEADNGEE
eukprot:4516336-Pyramimonas_sp.AAC.1